MNYKIVSKIPKYGYRILLLHIFTLMFPIRLWYGQKGSHASPESCGYDINPCPTVRSVLARSGPGDTVNVDGNREEYDEECSSPENVLVIKYSVIIQNFQSNLVTTRCSSAIWLGISTHSYSGDVKLMMHGIHLVIVPTHSPCVIWTVDRANVAASQSRLFGLLLNGDAYSGNVFTQYS